ncbi:MAG TPA: RodZ domain-containing protein [Gaiellaceae bacterium]|nr:RodZ domain-containing protein [Gaiellaceae bacterium]
MWRIVHKLSTATPPRFHRLWRFSTGSVTIVDTMFEIGSSLREARMRRGLSTEDVQKALRIRDRYLYALEEERWQLLPGDAYVKGFLRTYAEFLGLDGNLYVDEYNTRFASHEDEPFVPEPRAFVERPRLGILRPLVAIASIVAIVGSVAAWQLHGTSSPGRTASSSTTGAAPRASKPGVKRTRPAVTPALPTRATLSATRGRVWLQVRAGSATGKVLFEGILEQGKTLPVSLSPRVWVRVGAPWNLDVRLGGKIATGLPSQPGDVEITGSGLSPAA